MHTYASAPSTANRATGDVLNSCSATAVARSTCRIAVRTTRPVCPPCLINRLTSAMLSEGVMPPSSGPSLHRRTGRRSACECSRGQRTPHARTQPPAHAHARPPAALVLARPAAQRHLLLQLLLLPARPVHLLDRRAHLALVLQLQRRLLSRQRLDLPPFFH